MPLSLLRGMLPRAIRLARSSSRARAVETADGHPVRALHKNIRMALRARRRPLVVAGLVAASVVVLALTLLPPGGWQHGGTPESASETPSEPASSAAAVIDDDPVVAVPQLLVQRSGCLTSASVVCLDGVDQAGSAVMASDSYAVRQAQQGISADAGPDYVRWTPSLAERTGNMALVVLAPPDAHSKPASALVIKGEAGWRLREIFTY